MGKKYFSNTIPVLSSSAAEGFIQRGGVLPFVYGWVLVSVDKEAKVCSTTSAVQAEYFSKESP